MTIGAYEAKTHLPRLLDEVAKGSSFVITKHGRPVARLVGVRGQSPSSADPFAELAEFRKSTAASLGMSISDALAEGRK